MKILILGGYGNFGKRIAEDLSYIENIIIIIAGRNIDKANFCIKNLSSNSKASLKAKEIDIKSASFLDDLKSISPDIVIHTAGPFQDQDFTVAEACLEVESHYIDLSDDTDYVLNIQRFSLEAQKKGLLFVSGASSVPGLSSTIIDHYQSSFSEINTIEINIAPGNKAERGLATIEGILSYLGKPFKSFRNKNWSSIYGWMDPKRKLIHSKIGYRWFANVNVPDLRIFPERYNVKETVSFQAGLELGFLHFLMVFMAYLSKKGVIGNWNSFSRIIMKSSDLFKKFGSSDGAMNIKIFGKDIKSENKIITWSIYAPDGVGPYIPTISAVIIAQKIIESKIDIKGSYPCLGLYSLDEFLSYVKVLPFEISEEYNG